MTSGYEQNCRYNKILEEDVRSYRILYDENEIDYKEKTTTVENAWRGNCPGVGPYWRYESSRTYVLKFNTSISEKALQNADKSETSFAGKEKAT